MWRIICWLHFLKGQLWANAEKYLSYFGYLKNPKVAAQAKPISFAASKIWSLDWKKDELTATNQSMLGCIIYQIKNQAVVLTCLWKLNGTIYFWFVTNYLYFQTKFLSSGCAERDSRANALCVADLPMLQFRSDPHCCGLWYKNNDIKSCTPPTEDRDIVEILLSLLECKRTFCLCVMFLPIRFIL
jgi:hypothetical protein